MNPELTLYPYQIAGRDFLLTKCGDKPHKYLADAPGLGKTVEVCAAAQKLGAKSGLIICPDPIAVKTSWRHHLVEWGVCQREDVFIVNTGKDQIPTGNKFVIVGYALVRNDDIFRQLFNARYDFIEIDEAKRLRGLNTKTSKRILAGGNESLVSRGYWKWLTDGTPADRPIHLFPPVRALAPELIKPYLELEQYGRYFCSGYYDNEKREMNFNGASNTEELRRRLEPFMMIRKPEDVFEEFPEVLERTVYIDVGEMLEDTSNTPTATLRKAIGLAKLPWVIEYIQDRLTQVDKLVTFTFHREVTEKLADTFKPRLVIYGGMTAKQKQESLDMFINGPAKVLIAQIQSAGEAINGLQFVCNEAIAAEPDWSEGGWNQMIGRLRRIGQDKPVLFDCMIAEGTLDEDIAQVRRNKKRVLTHLFKTNWTETTTKEEIEMPLEQSLERIATALEALVAASPKNGGSGGSAKTADKETVTAVQDAVKQSSTTKPAGAKAEKVTIEDIRKAAKNAIVRLGESDETRQALQGVMKKHGSKTGKADGLAAGKMTSAVIADLDALTLETEEAQEDEYADMV